MHPRIESIPMNADPIPNHIHAVLLAKARQQDAGEVVEAWRAFKWQSGLTVFILLCLGATLVIGQPIGSIVSVVVVLPVIAAAFGIAWWTMRLESKKAKRWVRDYCPDGRLPICINCEYDLRGSTGNHCPECGTAVFQFADTDLNNRQ